MIDTINGQVLRAVADTMVLNLDPEADVHTVTVTLNGAHGGVDVKAEGFIGDGPDTVTQWEVR